MAPGASTAATTAATTATPGPSELLQPVCAWPLLGRLMAYGEPRQAAALLATTAKLIGRLSVGMREEQAAALSRSVLSGDRAGPCGGGVQAVLRKLPLQDMLCWLAAAAEQQQPHGSPAENEPAATTAVAAGRTGKEDGTVPTSAAMAEGSGGAAAVACAAASGPPPGQGAAQGPVREGDSPACALDIAPPLPLHGPQWQLLSMIACAVRRWLPALSRLAVADGSMQAVAAPGSEPAGVTAAGHVLRWVPVLVHAAAQQEEGEQGPGAGASPPAAPAPASASSADGSVPAAGGRPPAWRRLLLADVDVVGLLGRTLRQLGAAGGDEAAAGVSAAPLEAAERLHEACVALECVAAAFPREVAAALADGRLPPLHRAPEALLGGAAAPLLPPAQLQQRERLLSTLHSAAAWASPAASPPAAAAAVAAGLLPDPCVGGDGTAPASKMGALLLAAAAEAPGERGALPPTCSNPLCASLASNSEADLTLRACGGCGRPRYCCPDCQKAHWRAGHRAECVRPRGGGGAAS
ncbi:hypothetical protein TSOC_008263 [Tetrabaena socialis]|uniref:MYND-type domain-containing protein n=1 Tax=Tetrabaena socialis TaxID=47790 RepID=A0A2J7ZYU6_9CHLO|nr:hypothetical protein TSOC_008263 [Tetrabaena socialis]|eukprot:PNH05444.1 hypothetical protein TSOC_008263 [Tetrabaena socialis]